MSFRAFLKQRLSPSTSRRLGDTQRRLASYLHSNDLNQLALIFHTDKWEEHWYTQHYQRYFQSIRHEKLNILEIGVGGWDYSDSGGESLRMWKAYFPNSRIVGVDLADKTKFREHRIDIRQCDQTDSEALTRLSKEYGGFDIIIDDGSHLNEHVRTTFQTLFPLLNPNGFYSIEDTQTAYWPTWGGGLGNPQSSIEFFKSRIDGLNHVEYPVENYTPSYFDKNITEIAFFHNLIIIRKGNNDEKANWPQLIQREIQTANAEVKSHAHVPESL